MGPQCPHCGAVYEWTCGELEEQVTAPKVYFCQDCRGLFVLSPEDVEALQERFRPALEEATQPEPIEDFVDLADDDDRPRATPQVQAPAPPLAEPTVETPLALRERCVVLLGPHEGLRGTIVVIDGADVMLRVDGGNLCVRVSASHLQRA